MAELKNKIDFVYIFDVQMVILMETQMQVIFLVWMQKQVWA